MAADQRNALYRYRAPCLDPDTGRVAGEVLVTGVDVETAGWPSPCVFTKAGSCRWSEARQAYVPWPEPKVRVWGGGRLAVTVVLCILAIIFGPGLAFDQGSGAASTTGVLLIVAATVWVVLAWAIKRDYRAANRHDAEQDAARWQEAERRGHRPVRPSTDPRPPAVEVAGTPEMSYGDFLGFLHGLVEQRVRIVFRQADELEHVRGGYAVGYLAGVVESPQTASEAALATITTLPGGRICCGGFLLSSETFESARRLPGGAALAHISGLAVAIVPEPLR